MDPSIATPLASRPKRNRRQSGEAKANQRPGKAWTYGFPRDHDGEHAQADRQCPRIGRSGLLDEGQGLLGERTAGRRDAEHRRRLRNKNVAGDADKEAGRHRNGQKIGDEAEAQRARANKDQPDRDAEHGRGRGVVGRSGCREHGQRAGENRRNGRIRPHRKPPAVAEQSKPNRGRDQGKQADLRREVRKASGRHLRGNGDGGQRQAGDGVGAEVARTPPDERAQEEPVAPSRMRLRRKSLCLTASPYSHAFRRRSADDSLADSRPGGARNFAASSLPSRNRSVLRFAWPTASSQREADAPPRPGASRWPARGSSLVASR